jgi:hypothetical protein
MSRSLGSALPERLHKQLDGTHPEAQAGKAILISTVDPQGWPHPALLSYSEMLALGTQNLRLAVYRDGRTADNLHRHGCLTLCFVEPDLAIYVKARATVLPPLTAFQHLAAFHLVIQQVLEDFTRSDVEGTAQLLSGITFRLGADPTLHSHDPCMLLRDLADL